jgi:nucleoid-associated protein YgaU
MNKLIKAIVLSFILIGIAVYILVASMPGRTPKEKIHAATVRTAEALHEVGPAVKDGRYHDAADTFRAHLTAPADDSAGVERTPVAPPEAPPLPPSGAAAPKKPAPPAPPAEAGKTPRKDYSAPASHIDETPIEKNHPPRKHKVQPGETLFSIARKYYGDSQKWRILLRANPGIDAAALPVGKVLSVPHRASSPGKKAGKTSTPGPWVERHHVIAQGDTLYSLARKYYNGDTSKWKHIKAANELDEDSLPVGKKIRIPPLPCD